jgi:hypothetical protein
MLHLGPGVQGVKTTQGLCAHFSVIITQVTRAEHSEDGNSVNINQIRRLYSQRIDQNALRPVR